MALTQEEKTQKQVDAAVKAAVKRERASVKSVLADAQAAAKDAGDKAGGQALKALAGKLKDAYAVNDSPLPA